MISRKRTIRNLSSVLLVAAFSAAACSSAGAQNKAVSAATEAAPVPFVGNMGTSAQVVGEPLHLLVGRSMFINTDNRIRRVYVSNPDVLDSFTSSPHQIVITSKAPGLASLVLWDETGQSRAYLINSDIDVGNLHNALREAFPNDNIHVEGHGDQVELAGTVSSSETADAAAKLAALFSKNVANSLLVSTKHTPQVRLKVRVIEIDRSRAAQLGFNFFGPGVNSFSSSTGQFGAVTVGANPPSSASAPTATTSLLSLSSLLGLFYYNQGMQLGAAIQALWTKQIAQILAEPTLTAISGEKASFLSGGEFPYPVVQGGTGGFTSVTIQFRPYGVKVDFTPNVLADGTIQLKVAPEVSALDYSNEVTISGYTIPAISTRRADTQIELKSGQSFCISGLLDNRTTNQLEKIPGIGDIPILGKLFQSTNTSKSVEDLAVIVTPTLVDPLTDNPVTTQPTTAIPFIETPRFDKGFAPKVPPPQPQPQPVPPQVPIH
jgi:pilus assembly protein CpaC